MDPFCLGFDLHLKRTYLVLMNTEGVVISSIMEAAFSFKPGTVCVQVSSVVLVLECPNHLEMVKRSTPLAGMCEVTV